MKRTNKPDKYRKKIKRNLLASSIALALVSSNSWAIFQNGDFENGDFSHWETKYGSNPGLKGSIPFTEDSVVIVGGGTPILQIMSNSFDPRAPHLTLPRQGNYTAKLNNENGGYHVNYITQKDVITEDDRDPTDKKLHIRFNYAAVLDDPSHYAAAQPYFHVQLKDLTTAKVLYDDMAYSNQPGRLFYTTNDHYGSWRSTPFIDVDVVVPDSLIGHELEVRALAADCAYGGHGGYVYVDAFGANKIKPQQGCLNNVKARAKPGQVQVTWENNGADAYRVYRSEKLEGPYISLGETTSNYSTWLDKTVTDGKEYFYNVRPINSEGLEYCASGSVVSVVPSPIEAGEVANRPPYFVSEPKIGGDIKTDYHYQAEALDADGDDLTYSLLAGPVGMTIDSQTGLITWKPNTLGFYEVNIQVIDGNGGKATQSYNIEVIDDNLPPQITNQIPTRIPSGKYFSHQVEAVDPEGQKISYSLASQASGMTMNSNGLISWGNPQPGRYPITVVVADPHGAKDQQSVVIAVSGKPSFISTPIINGTINQPYTYFAQAKDSGGGTITYNLSQAPQGMTINTQTGEINWQPSQESVENITVEAMNEDGSIVTQSYKLTISAQKNRTPTITSKPKTYIAENTQYSYQATATDPDGDNLTWSLIKARDGIKIDSKTGLVSWTKTAIGSYPIVIGVSDQRGGVATQEYTLRVGLEANQAPQILSVPNTKSSLGAPYQYQLIAVDPDEDPLTYKITKAPNGATVSNTGLFTWNTPVLGQHDIELTVTDGLATVTQNYTLVITQESVTNQPPLLTSTPETSTVVNELYHYQLVATDPDGDVLHYQIKEAPAGATIDANGLFSWKARAVGSYTIKLAISDGHYEVEQNYTLVVRDSELENQPPQIISSPKTAGSINNEYEYQLIAVDPDNDPLSYFLEEGPEGMMLDSHGVVKWEKPTLGNHSIKLSVSDVQHKVEQSYTLAIGDQTITNQPPQITSIPKIQGVVNDTYHYQVQANDPDGDPLTYKLEEAPAGVIIDNNGLVTWSNPILGTHTIKIAVNDGNYTVTQTYDLAINSLPSDNRPPRITSTPVMDGQENIPYNYQVTAVDPDNDPIVYSLVNAPAGMTIDVKTGTLTWDKPTRGSFDVVIKASDGQAWAQQGYKVTIKPSATTGGVFTGQLLATPQLVEANEPVTVDIVLNGGTKPYEVAALTLDGSPVTVSGNSATVTSNQLGLHTLDLIARDAKGREVKQQTSFIVKNKADITAPTAEITAPAKSDKINVAEISTTTDIIGTASDDNLVEYQVYLSPADENKWVSVAKGNKSVINGKLGTLKPQTMPNGLYDLLLIVKDEGGNQSSAKIGVVISGEQKVGQFSLSFTDLDIDMGNLPLRLTRTYDTRSQNESLDFGYGWSVNYQDVKIQTNGIPGRDWDFAEIGSGLNKKFCPKPVGTRMVTVRLPDGKMEKFEPKTIPECNSWMSQSAGSFFQLDFAPKAGTSSTLEATDVGMLRVHNGVLFDYDSLDKVNPQQFKLTTKDGTVYYLDKSFGIRQIKDRHGNTLSYTHNGIQHSNGAGLIFTRDNNDRIVQVDAPDGRVLNYTYDGDGNLEGAFDPKQLETRFIYQQSADLVHQLSEIYGADGKRLFKAEFDDKGQLIHQRDGLGYSVNLEHDNDNNVDKVTDRNGNTTTYVYDDQGNITEVTDSKGNVTQYTYDQFGNETSVTDALGHKTAYEYDRYGNVTKETNALGFSTETTYNADGNPTQVIDELGRVSKNTYDQAGDLTQITDAMGNTTHVSYTSKGDLAVLTDQMGNTTRFGYQDSNGKRLKVSETDAAGNVTRFEYDKNGNETARKYNLVIDGKATEMVTRKTYDDNGNVLTHTNENGLVTTYQYDDLNQLIKVTDPLGQATQYTYNERGEQTQTLYPDGKIDSTTFDKNGNEVKTCVTGICTEITYDEADRPIQVKDALGNITQTQYDAVGNATATVDALGNTTQYQYDTLGRQIKLIDALGNTTESNYDAVGNLTKQTDALGNSSTTLYNDNNQPIKKVNALGHSVGYEYDKAGRNTVIIDALQNKTAFSYDVLGQLFQVSDALNNKTVYGYDTQGRQTLQSDANRHTSRFTYNKVGQRIQRTLPEGQKESWEYNAIGNVIKHTDFNGKATGYTYNASQQLAALNYPDKRAISYSYDALGNVAKVSDSLTGDLDYTYDLLGRITQVSSPLGQLSYEWDGNGNKVSQQVNTQGSFSYGYDALNRLTSITAIDGSVTSFEYDKVGNRTQINRSNGTQSVMTYNKANQLTGITHQKGSKVLAKFEYTLDENGRRTKVDETIDGVQRSVSYQYDATGKLLTETILQAGQRNSMAYTYDAMGNRLTKVANGITTHYSYDSNDQLISETTADITTSYAWDNNGNLIKKTSPEGEISYSWSSSNKLIGIDDQVNRRQVSYQYDGQDKRIGKVTKHNGQTIETQYLVDSERPYSEVVLERTRVDQGAWSETLYLHTPEGLGDLLTQDQTGQVNHLYQDAQGSTRLVTDQQGSTQSTFDYDAFGNALLSSNPDSAIKHRYVGEYLDQDSGFYHLRARDYDPKIGRFVSRDSFEGNQRLALSLNPYLYANADPVHGVDPSGYFGLIDLNISSSISTSWSQINLALQIYKKVDTALLTIQAVIALKNVSTYLNGSAFDNLVKGAKHDSGFINALENFDTALSVFASDIPEIIAGVTKSGKVEQFFKNTKNSLLIYGPTPDVNTPWARDLRIKIGRISLAKSRRDMLLEVGRNGTGGRLFGIGHTQGAHKTKHVQWFRMDWHNSHHSHNTHKSNSPSYHYHW